MFSLPFDSIAPQFCFCMDGEMWIHYKVYTDFHVTNPSSEFHVLIIDTEYIEYDKTLIFYLSNYVWLKPYLRFVN